MYLLENNLAVYFICDTNYMHLIQNSLNLRQTHVNLCEIENKNLLHKSWCELADVYLN